MDRLCKKVLPKIPQNLFHFIEKQLKIVHLNVRNILTKLHDMRNEDILKQVDIICVNETHMSEHDKLTPEMMNIAENFIIFQKDRNKNGGGVVVIVNKTLNPDHIPIDTHCEVVAVKISNPIEIILISTYLPPISTYTDEMSEIISLFDDMQLCVIGDFNEDILLTQDTTFCTAMKSKRLKQVVSKPTCDSRTLIDHVYASDHLIVQSDVSDCYFSDHDYVLCTTG